MNAKCLVLLPLLAACSLLPPEEYGDAPLAERAGRVAREVAAIRDLELRQDVPVGTKTKDDVKEVFTAELDEEWQEGGAAVERAYKVLGLVPRDLDLKPFLGDFFKEMVAGYYDPEAKEFFTIERDDDPDAAGDEGQEQGGDEDGDEDGDESDLEDEFEDRFVLAHELVHALEDQHFDLGREDEARAHDDDRQLAFSSLVEGSAMEGAVDHVLWSVGAPGSVAGPFLSPLVAALTDFDRMPVEEARQAIAAEQKQLAGTPEIVLRSMLFPYLPGWRFTNRLRAEFGWQAVDAAHRDPPESSEQILFPERYIDRRDRPVTIILPAPPAGFTEVGQQTLGLFGLKVLLATRLDDDEADDADGWDGDRLVLWETSAGDAAGWLLVFDHAGAAADFAATYRVLLRHHHGDNGRWAVVADGDRVAVAQDVPAETADEVARHLLGAEVRRAADDQAPDRWYMDVLRFPISLRSLDRVFEAKLLGGAALEYRGHDGGHRFELLNSLLLCTENNADRSAAWAGLGLVGFTSDRTLDYSFGRVPFLVNWHGRGTGDGRSTRLSLLLSSIDYENARGDGTFDLLWGALLRLRFGDTVVPGRRLRILFLPIPGI